MKVVADLRWVENSIGEKFLQWKYHKVTYNRDTGTPTFSPADLSDWQEVETCQGNYSEPPTQPEPEAEKNNIESTPQIRELFCWQHNYTRINISLDKQDNLHRLGIWDTRGPSAAGVEGMEIIIPENFVSDLIEIFPSTISL